MDIQIRLAHLQDAPVLAQFNACLAAETETLRLDLSVLFAGVSALLHDPAKGRYFVAEINGNVVGQLMITYEWSDWRNGNIWWIQSVYVRPESRRTGVFRRLFEHVRQLARAEKNVPALRLYMHADNARARQTYEHLGFRPTHYEVFEFDIPRPATPANLA